MNAARSTIVMRVLGGLLLAIAAVRFTVVMMGSWTSSQLAPPAQGFTMMFAVDYLTLVLTAVGMGLLIASFRSRKNL